MRRNRRLRWAAIPIAATLAFVLAGCTQAQLQGWLPTEPGTTNHVDRIIGLWVTSWIVLLAVGLITWGLTIWTVVVYRRRKGQTGLPVQLRYNMPIEIFYTIVPLILVIGFFAFTARDQAAIEKPFDEGQEVEKIQVYGKQWAWDFNYVTQDVYEAGIQGQPDDAEGAEAGDLVESEIPTLYLPVGANVEIQLDSRDVIHSFWIIDFLYKKDMLPGKTNYMYVVPEKEGTYAGKCAELCGEYHSAMLFNVKVVSQAEYDDYIQSLEDRGQTGQLGAEYDRNTNLPGTSAPVTEHEE